MPVSCARPPDLRFSLRTEQLGRSLRVVGFDASLYFERVQLGVLIALPCSPQVWLGRVHQARGGSR